MKKLLALLPLRILNLTTNKIPPEAGEVEEVSEVKITIMVKIKAEVEEIITTKDEVEEKLSSVVEEAGIETTKISTKVTLTLNVNQLLRMVIKISSM